MYEASETEDTVELNPRDVARILRRAGLRNEANGLLAAFGQFEDDEKTDAQMLVLDYDDLEPMDSESASFSLEAPSLKMLDAMEGQSRMPHEEPEEVEVDANGPAEVLLYVTAAVLGSGTAALCAMAFWWAWAA